jgi:hypothetical protein
MKNQGQRSEGTSREVRPKPEMGSIRKTKPIRQTKEKNVVINGIKRGR